MKYKSMEAVKSSFQKIKLIALDLDDTTLRSNGTLSAETDAALKKAVEQGIEVVVASGRSFSSLPQCIREIEGIRYAITSNGAAIYRLKTAERIHSVVLKPQCVKDILCTLREEDLCLEAFVRGIPHADERFVSDPAQYGCTRESNISYIQSTRIPEKNMAAFIFCHIDELDCIDIRCVNSQEKSRIETLLRQNVSNVYITSSLSNILEIVDPSAGKGAALCRLCTALRVPSEFVVAFGNADNDIDMLEYAGLGVAVGNATESCLYSADYVTSDNDNDGVAKVIRVLIS